MKTLKKALSIILGAAIMLSCLFGMQVSVAAEGTTLDVAVGEATVADGVVTVPVVVTNNPGFQTLAVTVGYDNTVLTLTGAAKKADFATAKAPGNDVPAEVGEISPDFKTIQWAYVAEAVTATGTIATFTFAVVEGATAKSTEITLTLAEAWDGANDVTANATAGTVDLVKEPEGPVFDASLATALYSKTVQITSKVGTFVTLYLPGVELDDVEFIVSKPEMTSPSYTYTGNTVDTVYTRANCENGSAPDMGLFNFSYANIGLYEMNSDITFTLYIIKDGKRVSYYTWDSFKVADLVKAYYTKYVADEVNAGLAVAILNLGTDAQEHFAAQATAAGYADNSLAKAPALNTDVDQSLAPAYGELPTFTTEKDAQIYGVSIQLLAAPSLRYTVYDANMTAVCKDPANVTINTSYSSGVLGDVVVSVNGNDLPESDLAAASMGMYTYTFSDVALYDADKVVTFNFAGTDDTSYSCKLTLMTLIAAHIDDDGTAGDVYRALATLSVAASNKFN